MKRQSQILSLLVSFELFLAIRYLRTPRRHRLAQFTALCAVLGIACGVAAMIVAQAAANGFRSAIQHKILAHTPHITVFDKNHLHIFDWQHLSEKIKSIENVKAVAPTISENALLIGKTNSAYALIKGQRSFNQNPNEKIKVAVGKDLAARVGLQIGDAAEIVSGNIGGEDFTPTSTAVEVGAIFETGLYEIDAASLRVSLEDAARLAGYSSLKISALEIETNDIYRSDITASQIELLVGGDFQVLDWQTANRPLFAALGLERRVFLLTLSLIVCIAVLNVTTTLALVVNERKSDIAVLKTCGARMRRVVLIFLFEGLLIGGIGVAAGVLLGLITCFVCNHFRLISLSPEIYSVSEIVLKASAGNILLTAGAAFVLILAASVYPAWTAAQIRPLEILRN